MKSPGNVTGEAFTYAEMRQKLTREIGRLKCAEKKGDKVHAMDHALNAAFTGYHLLEWRARAKEKSPPDGDNAHILMTKANNPDLHCLHDIVTKMKHVTITNSARGGAAVDVRTSVSSSETDVQLIADKNPDGAEFARSRISVKFGDKRAAEVLSAVEEYFEVENFDSSN